MTRVCRCGGEFEPLQPHHRWCPGCWVDRRYASSAGDRGYRAGAPNPTRIAPPLAPGLLRDCISLTHPDRHPAERRELATRTTGALLELRATDDRRKGGR